MAFIGIMITMTTTPAMIGRAEQHPEKVDREADLEGGGPDEVEERHQAGQSLSIDGHQIHNLSDRRALSCCITQHQRL